MQWNVVLQLKAAGSKTCERLTLAGLPRPCRILIVSCDSAADASARASHQALLAQLRSKSKSSEHCPGPIDPGCMSESEPACEHILVPVIAQAPLSPYWLRELGTWSGMSGRRAVLPAISPGLNHAQVFSTAPKQISQLQLVPWGGDPKRLASLVSRRALYGDRPRLFISYRRQEAAAVADQIFDEMNRRGFQVFLDRFSGTSGRLFPQEIAEELADRDVVLVLETPNILLSTWTVWEISFARTYRLGILALQWPGAPRLPSIANRYPISPTASGDLTKAELDAASNFIERGHTLAALTRRAFYEALVEAAALSKSGVAQPTGDGILEVFDKHGGSRGLVTPAGRPGCLAEVHRLARAPGAPATLPRILAGQHEHLRPNALDDLKWLSNAAGVDLSGRADVYKNVKALL